MFVSGAGGGGEEGTGDKVGPPYFCVSLLSTVITGAVDFERLTNIGRTIYTINVFVTKRILVWTRLLIVVLIEPCVLLAVFRA